MKRMPGILTFLPGIYYKFAMKRVLKKLGQAIENKILDEFLEMVLRLMRFMFCIDKNFRRNIEGFNARYTFKGAHNSIDASVIFKNNKMIVKGKAIPRADVIVSFKDGKALWEFLFSKDPDVFEFILENKVTYSGNVNYMMKFGYLARHLQLFFNL